MSDKYIRDILAYVHKGCSLKHCELKLGITYICINRGMIKVSYIFTMMYFSACKRMRCHGSLQYIMPNKIIKQYICNLIHIFKKGSCIHTYIHIDTYVCICAHMHTQNCTCICTDVCINVYIHVH